MERFSRTIQLIGREAWEKILQSKITIFGLGAVGSWATEILSRSGISHFRLIDFDKINKTDINRHPCASESSLNIFKTKAVKERIIDINPHAAVETFELFADKTTLPYLLDDNPTIVIDAIDSVGPKIELIEYAYENSIKIISSMGAGLRTDLSAIRKGDLFETEICPLARNLRKHLRRRGINKGIRTIYSEEVPDNRGLRPPDEESGTYKRGRIRNILGSYPPVTALFGIMAADEAIKIIISGNKIS